MAVFADEKGEHLSMPQPRGQLLCSGGAGCLCSGILDFSPLAFPSLPPPVPPRAPASLLIVPRLVDKPLWPLTQYV